MPVYQFYCEQCDTAREITRSIATRNDPVNCLQCGQLESRTITNAPRLAGRNRQSIKSAAINERAQHEPSLASRLDKKHPSNCSCCTGKKLSSQTVTGANGAKAFPAKRPWMISH